MRLTARRTPATPASDRPILSQRFDLLPDVYIPNGCLNLQAYEVLINFGFAGATRAQISRRIFLDNPDSLREAFIDICKLADRSVQEVEELRHALAAAEKRHRREKEAAAAASEARESKVSPLCMGCRFSNLCSALILSL